MKQESSTIQELIEDIDNLTGNDLMLAEKVVELKSCIDELETRIEVLEENLTMEYYC